MEQWRPIPGFPNYEVSDRGRVRLAAATGGHPAGYICKPHTDERGYVGMGLRAAGERRFRHVHTLVLEAFVGPRPSASHEGAHWDGHPSNNRLDNLRWATRAENAADALRHGTYRRGSANGRAKLTEHDICEMRRRRVAGETFTTMAREKGVSANTVEGACKGKTWKHVE